MESSTGRACHKSKDRVEKQGDLEIAEDEAVAPCGEQGYCGQMIAEHRTRGGNIGA